MAYKIDSLTARKALKTRREPYWHKVTAGRYLGYRKTERGGSWIARLRDDDGKQRYHSMDDRLDFTSAVQQAIEWFTTAAVVEDHRYRVRDAVADYAEHLKIHNSARASTSARNRLVMHLPDKLLNTELSSLHTAPIKAWHQSLVSLSDNKDSLRASKNTANRILVILKAALNMAYTNGLVATDQAWKRVKPFRDVSAGRRLFLTEEQVARLLKHTEGAFHNLLQAAVLTGARYGELVDCRVSDLDTRKGRLFLSGKTGERWCYLSDAALAFFKRQSRSKLPAALLLPKEDGTLWGESHQTKRMNRAVRASQAPRETVFYSLRHYHISKALLAGVPVQVVAENCGTSIRMIEKYYGKFLETDRRKFFNEVCL